MASAATSELRRSIGDAPRERRDRAGLGGFTKSVALSSESKEEGPGRPPGQHGQQIRRHAPRQVEGSSGSSQKDEQPGGRWLSM